MVGDFGQLLPILDFLIYVSIQRDVLFNNGIAAYNLFREVYMLDIIQKQSGNSKKQRDFRDILLRLRNGDSTLDNWKMLITRIEDKLNRIK